MRGCRPANSLVARTRSLHGGEAFFRVTVRPFNAAIFGEIVLFLITATFMRYRHAVLLLLIVTVGCSAGWKKVRAVEPENFPPRQQIQIWTGSQKRVFHAVRMDTLNLSGVPFQMDPECDSCRIFVPRGDIDSLRAGSKSAAFNKTTAAIVLTMLAWGLLYCAGGGCVQD